MKFYKHITLVAALIAVSALMPASAKNYVVPKAYMFGFVASFNDSIIHFTDIQEVDSVWLMSKKKMVAGRSNYSYQLRNYCAETLGMPNRTVVVVTALKRKDIEKKFLKLRKQYTGKKNAQYDIRYINASEFRFKTVNMDDSPSK